MCQYHHSADSMSGQAATTTADLSASSVLCRDPHWMSPNKNIHDSKLPNREIVDLKFSGDSNHLVVVTKPYSEEDDRTSHYRILTWNTINGEFISDIESRTKVRTEFCGQSFQHSLENIELRWVGRFLENSSLCHINIYKWLRRYLEEEYMAGELQLAKILCPLRDFGRWASRCSLQWRFAANRVDWPPCLERPNYCVSSPCG